MIKEIKYKRLYHKIDEILTKCESVTGGIIRYYKLNDDIIFSTYKGQAGDINYNMFVDYGLGDLPKEEIMKYINYKLIIS